MHLIVATIFALLWTVDSLRTAAPLKPQHRLFSTVAAPSTIAAPIQALPNLIWKWKGYDIRYTKAGKDGDPPIVLIHGFGASLDYYRKQIPVFAAAGYSVYAIDLLGFGGSEKALCPEGIGYSADLWSRQVLDFCAEVLGPAKGTKKPILAGNSIGSRICLEAALNAPDDVRGLLLYNAAAGINNKFTLYDTLTPPLLKVFCVPVFSLLDFLLKQEAFATWLFERTRKPENIRATLQSVYVNKDACDDELVASISKPAEDPNALKVFVEILTGAPGTTPDTFIDQIKCPIKFVWGDQDPFTPLDGPYGKYFAELCADEGRPQMSMTVVPGGHCPHDDCPEEANAASLLWLQMLDSSS
jgi:pimeloyl-ACP methyl ester carboxylesterase